MSWRLGVMLTSDENVVRVEMNVQYRVTDPERYLFSVTSADDSLRQATDSALRGVIGKYTMDRILTEGRTVIRSDTQRELEETIRPYGYHPAGRQLPSCSSAGRGESRV